MFARFHLCFFFETSGNFPKNIIHLSMTIILILHHHLLILGIMTDSAKNKKTWDILVECIPFVKGKCCDGIYVVCLVQKMHEEKGLNYAQIMMRRNYWLYHFLEHVCSACHKNNFLKQVMRTDATRKGQTLRKKNETVYPPICLINSLTIRN